MLSSFCQVGQPSSRPAESCQPCSACTRRSSQAYPRLDHPLWNAVVLIEIAREGAHGELGIRGRVKDRAGTCSLDRVRIRIDVAEECRCPDVGPDQTEGSRPARESAPRRSWRRERHEARASAFRLQAPQPAADRGRRGPACAAGIQAFRNRAPERGPPGRAGAHPQGPPRGPER